MTNFEKYKDVILEISKNGDRVAIDKGTKKVRPCNEMTCWDCVFYNGDAFCTTPLMLWLYEEYQEPTVDWSKVPVDTKVLVSDDGEEWHKQHFAKHKRDGFYTWYDGATSWTTDLIEAWEYAKLAEEENAE